MCCGSCYLWKLVKTAAKCIGKSRCRKTRDPTLEAASNQQQWTLDRTLHSREILAQLPHFQNRVAAPKRFFSVYSWFHGDQWVSRGVIMGWIHCNFLFSWFIAFIREEFTTILFANHKFSQVQLSIGFICKRCIRMEKNV